MKNSALRLMACHSQRATLKLQQTDTEARQIALRRDQATKRQDHSALDKNGNKTVNERPYCLKGGLHVGIISSNPLFIFCWKVGDFLY